MVIKIYKTEFTVLFRLFVWRRIHDISFLSSIKFKKLNIKILENLTTGDGGSLTRPMLL